MQAYYHNDVITHCDDNESVSSRVFNLEVVAHHDVFQVRSSLQDQAVGAKPFQPLRFNGSGLLRPHWCSERVHISASS
jgi:hypothetical protein